jgi:two-component SAPR family response regulator
MLQLKCLLIGNQQSGKILFEHVSKVPWLSFICKPINAREARHYLQEFATDIIFCDMATISDVEMEDFLADYAHNSLIIVVDSRTALSGSDIGSNVFSFLQRPVSFDQFFYAVCRAKEFLYPPVQQEYTPAADFVFIKY